MRANEIRSGYAPNQPSAGRTARTGGRRMTGRRLGSDWLTEDDRFQRGEEEGSAFTDYDRSGRYSRAGIRILPDRYYDGALSGTVAYKGTEVPHVEILEEAVQKGLVKLNERRSVWDNAARAERVLILDRAKPLYAWSTTLYSEDGSYIYHAKGGRILDSAAAFFEDAAGNTVHTKDLAEAVASGTRAAYTEADLAFLRERDPELFEKASMIAKAKRIFDKANAMYMKGQMEEETFLESIRIPLLYFLGQDTGHAGANRLRILSADRQFGKKALEGTLMQQKPAYRRSLAVPDAPPEAPKDEKKTRTRRRILPIGEPDGEKTGFR